MFQRIRSSKAFTLIELLVVIAVIALLIGVLLYHAVVGRPPLTGANDIELMKAIVSSKIPRPSKLIPGFPPLIEFGKGKNKSPRDTQIAACSYCHDGANGSKPVVFEGTVHDRLMINCSSCHQAHVREDPVMVRGSQAGVCLTCHKKQANEHPQVGKRVPDFDRMGCAGCHRVHRLPENQEGGG